MDMVSIIGATKSFDIKTLDLFDLALKRYASLYAYDNPNLDNNIESTVEYLSSRKNLFPDEFREGGLEGREKFIYTTSTNSTVDFIINYYAKAFLDNGYSPQYILLNVLNLLKMSGESMDAPYLAELFKEFNNKIVQNFKPSKDTKKIPEDKKDNLVELSSSYHVDLSDIFSLKPGKKPIVKTPQENKSSTPGGMLGGAAAAGAAAIGSIFSPWDIGKKPKSLEGDIKIAEYLKNAGFDKHSAITMVAIALAESSGNKNAIGDQHLVDKTWGPSIGLWQIRSIKSQKGTGGERDIDILFDPNNNAKSAYKISGGGKNFRPWTMWKNGGYLKYLDRADAAVSNVY